MPRYSYKCTECGKEFEDVKPMSKYKEPTTCECGKLAKRSISEVALSGFNNLGQSTGRKFG